MSGLDISQVITEFSEASILSYLGPIKFTQQTVKSLNAKTWQNLKILPEKHNVLMYLSESIIDRMMEISFHLCLSYSWPNSLVKVLKDSMFTNEANARFYVVAILTLTYFVVYFVSCLNTVSGNNKG